MTQRDLFGDAIRPDARGSYRLLGVRDTTTPGCCDCAHCDWMAERCKLAGRKIDVDLGACAALEMRA